VPNDIANIDPIQVFVVFWRTRLDNMMAFFQREAEAAFGYLCDSMFSKNKPLFYIKSSG